VKESSFVSAVVYARNAAGIIADTLRTLSAFFANNFSIYEIVCVNDSSSDNTAVEIKTFAKENAGVSVTLISTGYYQGVERAMNAGIDFAIGDFVFQFDSAVIDFELKLIMNVYERCLQGFDIVSCAPNKAVRKSSRLFYNLFNKHSRTQYPLSSESFRVISRRGINRVDQMNRVIFYRKALYANCGLKSDTLAYAPKSAGKIIRSKQEKAFRYDLAIDSFVLFTDLSAKLSTFMCFAMLLVTFGSGVYTVIIWLIGRPILGWTTTMLLLSLGLFGLFAILTMAIKYLSLILKLVFERKKYVIENVEKL
jgi:dolichol-phosphate mannosyltransferase